jgi:hypothetical protein
MPAAASLPRAFGALALASVTVLLAACMGSPAPATPAPTSSEPGSLPRGVEVEIYQTRFDYAERVLEIRIANESDEDLHIVSASFESPRFETAATYRSSVVIDAGRTTDLRVKLPAVACDNDSEEDARDAVVLSWRDGDAETTASAVPDDPAGVVDRIVGEDCLLEAVDDVVTITPATELRIDGAGAASVAWVDVTLAPTGQPGSVTIDQVGATVLLASASGLDWPVGVTLTDTDPPRTVSLDLRPTRCDPHAIAEDKRGTIFPLTVSTARGLSGTYDLGVSDSLRGQIYAWITAHCGS